MERTGIRFATFITSEIARNGLYMFNFECVRNDKSDCLTTIMMNKYFCDKFLHCAQP